MEEATTRPRLRDGMRAAAMLAPGPLLFGMSFGLLAQNSGLGGLAALVFSATTFAGSAQFAAISVLGVGGSAVAAVTAAVLLNARYAPMSVAAAGAFRGRWWRRLVEAQLLVDESWALAGRGGRFRREILLGAGLLLYPLWIAGTAAGLVIGDRLGTPEDYGLDGAFAALFLGLAMPTLQSRRAVTAACVAAAIVLGLTSFVPSGLPLVAASAACLLGVRR